MSNQEILTKAIEKAIAGGWKGVISQPYANGKHFYYPCVELLEWNWDESIKAFHDGDYEDYEEVRAEVIIFDHDFAKALWGDTACNHDDFRKQEPPRDVYLWKHHLMFMVIADDPIAYLGDNI